MYCSQCGLETFIPADTKAYRCTACGFLFYLNTASAVAGIIRNSNNEILFTIRKNNPAKNSLDLPGGFVEYGESGEQALQREINEELNLKIANIKYLTSIPNIYKFSGVTYNTLDLFYTCEALNLTDIHPSDDVSGYVFISQDKININDIGMLSIKKLFKDHTPEGILQPHKRKFRKISK